MLWLRVCVCRRRWWRSAGAKRRQSSSLVYMCLGFRFLGFRLAALPARSAGKASDRAAAKRRRGPNQYPDRGELAGNRFWA